MNSVAIPVWRRWLAAFRRMSVHLVVLVIFLGAWEFFSQTGLIDSFLVPPPSQVGMAIFSLYFVNGTVYYHLLVTFWEVVAGFGIGAPIGIALAVACTLSPAFNRYFRPYAIMVNVTPGLALVPIVITWFGFGVSSKIALVAIVTFFPVFVNTLTGLMTVDSDRAEMFRVLRANSFQTFWKLNVPSALPLMMAGLKVGSTVALVGAIVAEFSQASAGIGLLMNRFSFQLDMASALAALLSMSLMGLLIFGLIQLLDDYLVFWRHDHRLEAISRRKRSAWLAASARLKEVPSGSKATVADGFL